MLGSVGQGDLAPMADLAAELFGDFELLAKEGIALINSNAFSTALASLAVADAERLVEHARRHGRHRPRGVRRESDDAPSGHRRRPAVSGALLRARATARPPRRELPLGAGRRAQPPGPAHVPLPAADPRRRRATRSSSPSDSWRSELNASQENPLVIPDEDRIVSVANFDILPLAAALDFLRVALAPALTSACERLLKLLQGPLTGLPDGLAPRQGLAENSLGELGVAAQALHRRGAPPRAARLLRGRHLDPRRGDRGPDHHGAAGSPPPLRDGPARRAPRRDRVHRRRPGDRAPRPPDARRRARSAPSISSASASRSWARATRCRPTSTPCGTSIVAGAFVA